MIPKIIHLIWVGGAPKPKFVLDCIESWRRHSPDWEIMEWGDRDVEACANRYVKEAYARKKWAFVSDWLRLHALERFGGFYFDTDMEMKKPFDCFLGERFVISWERMNGRTNFNCGVIGAEKGSETVRGLIGLYDGISFVKDDGELDQTPNTERFLGFFKSRWGIAPGYGTETVRFADGCVIYPWTHFLPKDGYTTHHYAGSWLDPWFRKVWLRAGKIKLVRFKRRKGVPESAPLEFMDGERPIFSLPLGPRKRVALVKGTPCGKEGPDGREA